MSGYLGDFRPGQTVRCRFNTVNTSEAPATLASGAVTVSKDGADVTPSGGVTYTTDAGGVTGRNLVVIDTSVDPTTFTAGSEYSVRLSGTSNVGGTSVVGQVVGEWSIANRLANLGANAPANWINTAAFNAGATLPNVAEINGIVWTPGAKVDATLNATDVTGELPAKLAADGLDNVVVETGVNARQALALIGAAVAGKSTGLDTGTVTYFAMGLSGTTTPRIAAAAIAGNRSATTLTPPT